MIPSLTHICFRPKCNFMCKDLKSYTGFYAFRTSVLHEILNSVFFKKNYIGILRGGVKLGPLGTAATNRPIVPVTGDYDDAEIGGMIGRENRSTRRKPAPAPLCPSQIPHD
jgi:hypothetical protein